MLDSDRYEMSLLPFRLFSLALAGSWAFFNFLSHKSFSTSATITTHQRERKSESESGSESYPRNISATGIFGIPRNKKKKKPAYSYS